jgi:hypothetical protein
MQNLIEAAKVRALATRHADPIRIGSGAIRVGSGAVRVGSGAIGS